jgi:hypothetical protein
MPYSEKIKTLVGKTQPSLGTDLGRWSVVRDITMQRIATLTGATRQTVYNWFTGATEVTPAYQERVSNIVEVLKKTSQSDDAWRILCTTFNLKL